MTNKRAKQAIVDCALKGRRLYWFGEFSEKFLANSLKEVIDNHREILGSDEAEDIITSGDLGEIKMSTKEWFKIKCWNENKGKMVPSIDAVYGVGFVQVSTSYS